MTTHFPDYPDRVRPWYHHIFFWRPNRDASDQQQRLEIQIKARETVSLVVFGWHCESDSNRHHGYQVAAAFRSSSPDVGPEVAEIITSAFLSGDHEQMNSLTGELARGVLNALQRVCEAILLRVVTHIMLSYSHMAI